MTPDMSKPARLTVSPALAQQMLDGRVPSRAPRAQTIAYLAGRLEGGDWYPEVALITTLADGLRE